MKLERRRSRVSRLDILRLRLALLLPPPVAVATIGFSTPEILQQLSPFQGLNIYAQTYMRICDIFVYEGNSKLVNIFAT